MKKLVSIMLVTGALVLAASVPSQARENHDGHARAVLEHRGGGEHRVFEDHRGFEHGRGGISIGFGWGTAYPYSSPAYAYAPPPTYWYCPTYGAYYPSVASCPMPWVPVRP
jgi:hypothetical protein